MKFILRAIWLLTADGGAVLRLDSYEVGFYVRHVGTRSDIVRHTLILHAGLDPTTGRSVYSIPSFEDPSANETEGAKDEERAPSGG